MHPLRVVDVAKSPAVDQTELFWLQHLENLFNSWIRFFGGAAQCAGGWRNRLSTIKRLTDWKPEE